MQQLTVELIDAAKASVPQVSAEGRTGATIRTGGGGEAPLTARR